VRLPAVGEQVELEAEDGDGPGSIMDRGAASGLLTAVLMEGESLSLTFNIPAEARYLVSVITSNDNFGPLETVDVSIDGANLGQFSPPDTGNFGEGWNIFVANELGEVDLGCGEHEIELSVSGGDSFGVEVDVVILDRVD
jgi:hypothetical protein